MSVVMTHKVPCYQLGTSLHVRNNFIEKMGGIYIVACERRVSALDELGRYIPLVNSKYEHVERME